MDPTDQDIDTAGTSADPEYRERRKARGAEPPDPTAHPVGADPRTVGSGGDAGAAASRPDGGEDSATPGPAKAADEEEPGTPG